MAMAKQWNPMEDAYKNKNFNKYTQGPGADLDDELQPGAMASKPRFGEKRDEVLFQLCLKNVPADMTEKALWNLCANYGKVTYVRRSPKTPYVFVTFATLNDMERALEKFRSEKPQGIEADISKNTASNLANNPNIGKFSSGGDRDREPRRNERERNSESGSSSQPDMSKRDSRETMDTLKRLSASSKGHYNAEKDEFVKNAPNFEQDLAQIQYCNLCKKIADKICQRCGDYYCSVECQKKDWSRHRLFCFPMPELVAPIHPPVHNVVTSASHSRAEKHSSTSSLNDSFENKSKPKSNHQRQDNRNDDNHQRQQQQQRGGYENKRGPQEYGGDNRNRNDNQNRNDNRQQNFNRGGGGGSSDYNNQENRKNVMNQNKYQKDDEHNSSFENKKKFERKNDFERNSTVSNSSKKDSEKLFETNKPSPNMPAPERSNVPVEIKKPVEIIRADYPKSGSVVCVTAVLKPNKVFIRSMDAEDNVDYVKTINLINNEAKKAKPLTQMPKKSDLAITDFQGDGYYRVIVLNPESEDKISVAYIDFGNIDYKKLSELKEISPELISLKRHALTLILKDVEDFEPTEKVLTYMNSYVDAVGKDLKLVYDKRNEKGPLEGELVEVSTNENFNKTINDLRDVKVATLKDEPVFSRDIKVKVLPEGENVTLIVLDTSLVQTGAISCVLGSDLAEIDRMTAIFADYVKKTKGPYTPRLQEICLVQYDDDCWYRAECIEVVGDQNPSVIFTDFGNLTTAHIDKIRKYPKELIMPCVTITCLLGGMPEDISLALSNRLKELIPTNDKIIADKVEVVDEQTNLIQLNQVVETLQKEKLLNI